MNRGKFLHRGSRCVHALAAIAFATMAGCIIVAPNGAPDQAADTSPPPPPPAPVFQQPPVDPALQQLVSPIALYPDPILADVLPAATYPDQIQQAQQFVQYNPTPPDDQIAAQNWDPSVAALVHYPSVLQYMAANIQWTESLGSAFVNQQPQVMEAIQDLRAQAQAVGNLETTPDEEVDDEGGFIYIRPAVDGVIFVPFYDPVLVYREHSEIDYRYRYRDGAWLNHGFDWEHHDVYAGDWHNGWAGRPGDWHRNPGWAPPQQHWEHDQRFGPVHQVAPQHFTQPHELQGRDFHPVPQRPVETEHREPNHFQPRPPHENQPQNQPRPDNTPRNPPHADDHPQNPPHHDDHPQNQPKPRENPKPHVNAPPPPPPAPKSPPPPPPPPKSPPPPPHAKPMPPTKQAPPKGPPQKPEGGN